MSFEQVMGAISGWSTAADTLAAIGALAALEASGQSADPAVTAALRAVRDAVGVDLSDLAPPQLAMIQTFAKVNLHQAGDLIDNPTRTPEWSYTDPAIVEGYGRGSSMVPGALAQAPELSDVTSFLDIGTGGGWLAIAATDVWPKANIVGIDIFRPSLDIARANVDGAGLGDRITIREQDVTELEDDSVYDCAWFPTFFFTGSALDKALPRVVQAVQPGGWLALARFSPPPEPLPQAVSALRCVRSGGEAHSTERLTSALETAGCANVHVLPTPGPAAMQYILGQRPA